MNEKQAEVNDLTKSISRLLIDENSDSESVTYNKHMRSKVKMNTLSIKLKMTIHGVNITLYHTVKATEKYKHYFNVLNSENNSVKDISILGPDDTFLRYNIVNDNLLEDKINKLKNGKKMFLDECKMWINRQYHLHRL